MQTDARLQGLSTWGPRTDPPRRFDLRPMPVPRDSSRFRLQLALAGWAALASCRTADPVPAGDRGSAAAFEARVADAAEARLASMFPEIQGVPTRAAIAETVLDGARSSGIAEETAAVRARAIEALRAGDDETARQLLSELAADREAKAARVLRAAGDVDGALAAFTSALDIAPQSASLLRERGETALEDGLERNDRTRLDAASVDFQSAIRRARAEDSSVARAWLGESRAARALGDSPRALAAARTAFAAARHARDLEGVSEIAERTLAAATLDALDSSPEEKVRTTLAGAARTALQALLAVTPDDPWAWARLAETLAASGSATDARTTARTGLAIFARDSELADALAESTRSLGGREAVVATFEEVERRDPTDPGAVWRPAVERYARGLDSLARGRSADAEESFREAGRGFLRAGALAPDRRSEANSSVARALVGVGLARWARDDSTGARSAFLEADSRDPDVLTEPLAPDLSSGIDALRQIATTWRERGADPSRADATDCLAEAATTYAHLRRIAPRDADEAVLATGLARDAALAIEARARRDAEKGRSEAARSGMEQAKGLMEAAHTMAADAARQRPTDAAVVRLPGKLLTYFLQRDVPQAEGWLRSAVKLSEEEVAAARVSAAEDGLDAPQREERERRLEEAESRLGEAYQDLGVLHLDLKGDAHGAKAWFEKALATGPDPREDLRGGDGWIARCDAAILRGGDTRLPPEKRWGALP